MQYDAGLEAGVQSLPAHHDRARDGALRDRAGANCLARTGVWSGASLAPIGRIGAGGIALKRARDRRQQSADRERLLNEVRRAELGRSDRTLDVSVAGNHYDGHARLFRLYPAQKLDAV